jgi:glycyl-tRNA synthetase
MIANRKLLENLIDRRFVYAQAFEIHGGCGGLYDYGPIGCAIATNLEQLWRDHFIL